LPQTIDGRKLPRFSKPPNILIPFKGVVFPVITITKDFVELTPERNDMKSYPNQYTYDLWIACD